MPLGTFSVRTALSGFKESVTTDVRVTQDDVTRVRTALTIGELSETLTVSSSTAVLQTERADVRTEISSMQLQNLPVPPGRNYQNMFVTVPGISPPENMHSVAVNPSRGLGFIPTGRRATRMRPHRRARSRTTCGCRTSPPTCRRSRRSKRSAS